MMSGTSRRPKALIVGPHPPPPGGMANFIANLKSSRIVDFYSIRGFDTDYPRSIKGTRILEILYLPVMYLRYAITLLFNSPDLVHVHSPSFNSFFKHTLFASFAKGRGIPVLLHIHGGRFRDFFNASSDKRKKRIRELLSKPDLLAVLSDEWKEFFSEITDSKNIRVIENGVPLERFTPVDHGSKSSGVKILFVGAVKESKGVDDLLQAIVTVCQKHPEIQLAIVGGGDLNKYEKIATEKGINKNIHFTGVLTGDDLVKKYSDANIFILPSHAEGMPLVLLEAMSMKLACIATNVGAIPGILKPEGGILINPKDIEALTNSMLKLVENPELVRSMGDFNRNLVEREYSFNKTAEKIRKAYDELIIHH
jgi:glycosyltransferase involved in cell wall biosynthesis